MRNGMGSTGSGTDTTKHSVTHHAMPCAQALVVVTQLKEQAEERYASMHTFARRCPVATAIEEAGRGGRQAKCGSTTEEGKARGMEGRRGQKR